MKYILISLVQTRYFLHHFQDYFGLWEKDEVFLVALFAFEGHLYCLDDVWHAHQLDLSIFQKGRYLLS